MKVMVTISMIHSSTGSTSAHSSTGSTSAHSSTGSTSAHSSTGSTSVHSSTGSTSAHSSTGSTSAHSSTGSTSAHSSTGSTSAHSSTGSTSAHSSTGSTSVTTQPPDLLISADNVRSESSSNLKHLAGNAKNPILVEDAVSTANIRNINVQQMIKDFGVCTDVPRCFDYPDFCFTNSTPNEMLKKIWNTDEAVGIIICCIDRFYITDGDLKTLKSGKQLNDQVIDAYICQLTKNLPFEDGIQHIQSHKLTKLFKKGTITFGVKEKKSLQSSKMIVGACNINSHWMFLVIYPALKEVKLYNSLGLGHSAGVETDILQKWRVACKILDLDGSWKISSQISAMQEDTVSCGAFCLSFAESVVLGEPVKKALSKRDVADFRLKIGHAIIEKSGKNKCQTSSYILRIYFLIYQST
ncbi:uncharacterized protein [Clytia hemisphaerica]|uniref:uncharacterized protein isoform X2 n=1 Tax=Clytia hemisphaerica TaxID=252671 RepID=UPI0034D693B2